jgi:hypothetical protein
MSTDYVEQTTALIDRVEGRELLPHAVRLLSDGVRGAARRRVGGRAVGHLRPRALLQLDRGRRGSGQRAPRRPHPPVEEAFRLDRQVIEQLGWHASNEPWGDSR